MGVMVQIFMFPLLFIIAGGGVIAVFASTIVWTMSIGTIEDLENSDIPGGEAK
jgi:hypothetical protein